MNDGKNTKVADPSTQTADGLPTLESETSTIPVARPLRQRARPTEFDPIQITVDGDQCKDLSAISKKEWLLTNGLGGYAMSTVIGLNTRREHGLLVASFRRPSDQHVILSRLAENVIIPGANRPLDTTFYPGVVHPRGYELQEKFELYPIPRFVYRGRRWRIEKRISMVHGENTVIISYKLLPQDDRDEQAKMNHDDNGKSVEHLKRVKLRVRPLFAFREVDQLSKKNNEIQTSFGLRAIEGTGSIMRCTPYANWQPVYLVCPDAHFKEDLDWYKSIEYPQDRYLGRPFSEDLWSYGYYDIELSVDKIVRLICSTHPRETHSDNWVEDKEIGRRVQVMKQSPDETPFARRLTLAGDQFFVGRDTETTSMMAGFPRMEDYSRDTMIALPGLTLVTGKHREAKSILRAYARALDHGMLPVQFPDATVSPSYKSVDSALWFYVAIFKYLQYTNDFDFVRTELRIPLLETMRYFEEGTKHGVQIDKDGLLISGEPGLALTWMDASHANSPVTPREGKAVEVNALWYNALKLMERLAERFSIPSDMARFAKRADQVEENFMNVFWNEKRGCLRDVVSSGENDDSVRPNQILAVSLPFPLLDSESSTSIVRVVGEMLLTPCGLRTLEPGHLQYEGAYEGSSEKRALAYHQGTSWSWLMGPYVSALVKARGVAARTEAMRLLKGFERHLLEDGIGQVSQVFWGDAPHWPRGASAHATAVAELLRCYYEDVLGRNPGMNTNARKSFRRV